MRKKNYHHGNLRKSMIEAGISIINKESISSLSLRKVAQYCNVSHNAPYRHFENKDNLMKAIQSHIATGLAEHLKASDSSCDKDEDKLLSMGINYVRYFVEHPSYYRFLFMQPNIHMSINDAHILCEDFEPFSAFITAVEKIMQEKNIPKEDYALNIVTMLSLVDGLTSIFISENVDFQGDYLSFVERVLREKISF